MLGTYLHEFGHFFVGKLHFAGKDFLLDAGREVVCDVDASCIVAGAENGGAADTVFLCDPVTGFLSRVVVITVITTTFSLLKCTDYPERFLQLSFQLHTVSQADSVSVRGSGFAVPTDSGKSTQWFLRGSQIGAA